MITFSNDEVYPVNFKVYDVLFEILGDYSCMIRFITEESLNFGLLTFLILQKMIVPFKVGGHEFCIMLCLRVFPMHFCV